MTRPMAVSATCALQFAVSLVPAGLSLIAASRIASAAPQYRHSIAMFTGVTAALAVLSGGLTWGLWKGLRSIWFSAFVLDLVATLALIHDIYQDKYSRQFHDFAVALAFACLTIVLAAPSVARYYLHRNTTTEP